MNKEELSIAQTNFWKRKEENKGKQVNNSSLYAGSPMYYYCRFCDALTEVLPESHLGSPVTICDPCKELNKLGAIPKR